MFIERAQAEQRRRAGNVSLLRDLAQRLRRTGDDRAAAGVFEQPLPGRVQPERRFRGFDDAGGLRRDDAHERCTSRTPCRVIVYRPRHAAGA